MNELYDHYSVSYGPNVNSADGTFIDSAGVLDEAHPVPTTAHLVNQDLERTRIEDQSKDYFLFVHGWRLQEWERVADAESAYKRMYWAGYKGQFGMFDWPTEWVDTALKDSGNFDRSEYVAWNSAPGLFDSIESIRQSQLPEGGKLSVMAHSMGNIPLSEALYQNESSGLPLVDTAIMSQAAISDAYFSAHTNNLPSIYADSTWRDSTVIEHADPSWTEYRGFDPSNQNIDAIGGLTPRFVGIGQSAGKILDYYNADDYALGLWKLDQALKPTASDSLLAIGNAKSSLDLGNVTLSGGLYDLWVAASGRDIPGYGNTTYGYDQNSNTFYRHYADGDGSNDKSLSFNTNAYEMFAFAASSRVAAVGTTDWHKLQGVFAGGQNLSQLAPSFNNQNTGHSAEFVHSYLDVKGYWTKLVGDIK